MSRLKEKLLFTSYNPMTSYVLNIFILFVNVEKNKNLWQ